ncbi:hypothetical protein LOTGIDRAFT_163803 [Lottia gigantea]|uniref:Uncharacterized protein n=1 Tax=Lottia gigantea TaxID=225164 RepID=V3ZH80_LOTGI|nr:hypothetical protein LOTGIDRAFT_163803 [Lottia gigantea]ESO90603.1 hypothetical protein LOTGIDRAFT_163803 [Lottia gigantea]
MELHQKFKEKNLGSHFEDDDSSLSSGYGSASPERAHDTLDCSWSSALPELFSATISQHSRYASDLIQGPICEHTIRQALMNLRPVPHPKDFLAKRYISVLLSPFLPSSPGTLANSTTIDTLEAAKGQRSSIQDLPPPCPENIHGWQNGSYLNGLARHADCLDIDTDMTGRFIIKLKQTNRNEKKPRLLSKLRFWRRQSNSSQDEIHPAKINKEKRKSGSWKRLFCCFSSKTDE